MSHKTPSRPGPGQGELFPTDPVAHGDVMHPSGISPDAHVGTESTPGPSVNLFERATHLHNALDTIAKMSRTTGLSIASTGPARRQLEGSMGDVDIIVGRAEAAQPERLLRTKQDFAKAIGKDAMVASGLVSEGQARADAHADFQDFMGRYSGSTNRKARDSYRRQLERNQRIMTQPPKNTRAK